MKYVGPLYGKIGRKAFDTGKTSTDWDRMENALKFYADPRKYKGANSKADDDEEVVAGFYRLDVTRDAGKKARDALNHALNPNPNTAADAAARLLRAH